MTHTNFPLAVFLDEQGRPNAFEPGFYVFYVGEFISKFDGQNSRIMTYDNGMGVVPFDLINVF